MRCVSVNRAARRSKVHHDALAVYRKSTVEPFRRGPTTSCGRLEVVMVQAGWQVGINPVQCLWRPVWRAVDAGIAPLVRLGLCFSSDFRWIEEGDVFDAIPRDFAGALSEGRVRHNRSGSNKYHAGYLPGLDPVPLPSRHGLPGLVVDPVARR